MSFGQSFLSARAPNRACRAAVWPLLLCTLPAAAQYTVFHGGGVVRLEDHRSRTIVSVLPSTGNIAIEMKVRGHDILRFPFASVEEFRKKPALAGIPLLAPWANRLDEPAFYANGKKYAFKMDLGNIRADRGGHPIHGFLTFAAQWQVTEVKADRRAAWVTSRLEFFRQQEWMTQFPFAHTVEVTYRLSGGVLEVATRLHNVGDQPMPVAIGFHPYFQLTDSNRDDWTINVGARTEWILTKENLPAGETRPIERFLPDPRNAPLRGLSLDHVFSDLARDASGRASMSVRGKSQKIEVLLGPKYRAVVIYAPAGPNRNFICFEPMAGITNALNLAHRGVYKELQSIPPRQSWAESFWVRPSGFGPAAPPGKRNPAHH